MSSEASRELPGRLSEVPEAFRPHLDVPDRGATPEERLTDAGIRALGRALASGSRLRASAFDLLAADGLITYACEAALESADPDAALVRIVDRVARASADE